MTRPFATGNRFWVTAVRHLLAQRHLAILVCVASLLLKLLVPTGYMIDGDHGHMAIVLCSGTTPARVAMDTSAAMNASDMHGPAMHGQAMHGQGMHGDMADHDRSKDHSKVDMPCAFAGLSSAMLAPIDPIQIAGLIAYVMAIGLVGILLHAPVHPAYLRPPLRAPPARL